MTQYTIGQIIQGEAGNNVSGQFAVASTIYNRGTLGSGTFGSDFNAIVNAPGQFVGNLLGGGGAGRVPPLSEVSPSAQTFAQAILDGSLPSYGDVGNAQYFQSNQGQPSSIVGTGTNIGGNYFSDRFGAPSSSFSAPAFGGTLSPVTGSGPDALTAPGGSDVGASFQTGAGGAPSASDGVGTSLSANPGGAPFSEDITNIPVAGVNAPIGSGQINTTPPASKEKSQQQGQPLQITGDLPNAITQAGNASTKATAQLGQDVQQSAGTLAAAGTSWLGSIFTAGTSLFVRSGLVLLALVLLMGAFLFFYAERQTAGGPLAA